MDSRLGTLRDIQLWGGPAAMLGGALWIAGAFMIALRPEGCVASDCYLAGRSMRDTSTAAPISLAGLLLIGAGVAAVIRRVRSAGRHGRMERIGLVASLAGLGILPIAVAIQALFFDGDFPYMPHVALPAGFALILGCLLVGITIAKTGVLRRWAGALLLGGSLALLGFNDQDTRALLAIPFGIAWISIGYLLWSSSGEPSPEPYPVNLV